MWWAFCKTVSTVVKHSRCPCFVYANEDRNNAKTNVFKCIYRYKQESTVDEKSHICDH